MASAPCPPGPLARRVTWSARPSANGRAAPPSGRAALLDEHGRIGHVHRHRDSRRTRLRDTCGPHRHLHRAGLLLRLILFCMTFSVITWHVLSRPDGPTLTGWLHESASQRHRRRTTETMYGTAGPSAAVALCAVALIAVASAAMSDELRDDPRVICLAVAVGAATWFLLVVVFAVHYTRENAHGGGLDFPSDAQPDAPGFVDFVCLAVQVATTFSASDVTVRNSAMRREGHDPQHHRLRIQHRRHRAPGHAPDHRRSVAQPVQ